jgi:hypothetical protein
MDTWSKDRVPRVKQRLPVEGSGLILGVDEDNFEIMHC